MLPAALGALPTAVEPVRLPPHHMLCLRTHACQGMAPGLCARAHARSLCQLRVAAALCSSIAADGFAAARLQGSG